MTSFSICRYVERGTLEESEWARARDVRTKFKNIPSSNRNFNSIPILKHFHFYTLAARAFDGQGLAANPRFLFPVTARNPFVISFFLQKGPPGWPPTSLAVRPRGRQTLSRPVPCAPTCQGHPRSYISSPGHFA
jgi:hypothetical protein